MGTATTFQSCSSEKWPQAGVKGYQDHPERRVTVLSPALKCQAGSVTCWRLANHPESVKGGKKKKKGIVSLGQPQVSLGGLVSHSRSDPEKRQKASEADTMAETFRASGNCWVTWTRCGREPSLLFPRKFLSQRVLGSELLPQEEWRLGGKERLAGRVTLQRFNPLTPLRQPSASRNTGPTERPRASAC